jgi:hypothetical protein
VPCLAAGIPHSNVMQTTSAGRSGAAGRLPAARFAIMRSSARLAMLGLAARVCAVREQGSLEKVASVPSTFRATQNYVVMSLHISSSFIHRL